MYQCILPVNAVSLISGQKKQFIFSNVVRFKKIGRGSVIVVYHEISYTIKISIFQSNFIKLESVS